MAFGTPTSLDQTSGGAPSDGDDLLAAFCLGDTAPDIGAPEGVFVATLESIKNHIKEETGWHGLIIKFKLNQDLTMKGDVSSYEGETVTYIVSNPKTADPKGDYYKLTIQDWYRFGRVLAILGCPLNKHGEPTDSPMNYIGAQCRLVVHRKAGKGDRGDEGVIAGGTPKWETPHLAAIKTQYRGDGVLPLEES